jgi:hypothetical protein
VPLGAILERPPTVDQVEVLLLIGHLELAQRLGHQVDDAKTTRLMLLHLLVDGVELGGLLLDPRPPFRERGPLKNSVANAAH